MAFAVVTSQASQHHRRKGLKRLCRPATRPDRPTGRHGTAVRAGVGRHLDRHLARAGCGRHLDVRSRGALPAHRVDGDRSVLADLDNFKSKILVEN